uniref:Uncharacterized protein n=1 Tax=Aegilops tauschii subsp. strangulata TaxID=200361 RepID=A0A453GNG1_AEGTS
MNTYLNIGQHFFRRITILSQYIHDCSQACSFYSIFFVNMNV